MKPDSLKPNKPFSKWLDAASPYVKDVLATLADTSDAMFRQWAAGRRQCSAEKAGLVESATLEIYKTVPGAPTPLSRGDMCEACAKCHYFQDAQQELDDLK